ncbi:MAG: type 1 glutamine amidotransferase [Desulfobacterales bacterium]|nr:type 1 glutamine amidotransferase [Desulfobacterales bacterium]
MKKALIITHDESEGPGTLGDFLNGFGLSVRTVRLYNGESLPGNVAGYDAIVTMGGAMSVNEEYLYPFLAKERVFLKEAIDGNIPVLGICLGAQMIAKACYASVGRAPEKELGWRNVSQTELGQRDILFQGLPANLQVFQWHNESFEVPQGGSLLATSAKCPNQAFRYRNAYGLQFHIEVTRDMLIEWLDTEPECEACIQFFEEIEHDFYTQARMIYANFLWFIDICKSYGSKMCGKDL